MFFLSLSPGELGGAARIVALDQTFKNVRKYYRVVEIYDLPWALEDKEIDASVIKIWRDKDYMIRKRVFSQDGRPSRIVMENPRLLVNRTTTGERLIHLLRRSNVPVEGFFVQISGGWSMDPGGKALGDDYRVSVTDLINALMQVYDQNRLDFDIGASRREGLVQELDQIREALKSDEHGDGDGAVPLIPGDLLLATSIPVWFRETIRYHRPYRA